MALFRRFALNIAKLSPVKDSMKGKLKRAAWDDDILVKFCSKHAPALINSH